MQITITSIVNEFAMNSQLILNLLFLSYVNCRTLLASNSRQLRDHLRVVNAGDTIQMRDGYYSGIFVANRFGRSNSPIRLVGSRRAILSNRGGTALYVTGQYWQLRGFTVANSRRGVAIQNGKYNILERLNVRNMEEDGIALRQDSDNNTIRDCLITRTGTRLPQYGFGVTIGSGERQSYRGYVDRSDRNSIINCRFQTSSPAEAIHAYEGTCCGLIRDNYFDGRPNTNNNNPQFFNRFWVSVNGNNYRIERNNGRNAAIDGFRVRMSEGYDYGDYGGGSGGGGRSGQNGQNGRNGVNNYVARGVSRDYESDDYDIEIQGCGNQFRANTCVMSQRSSNGYCIRVVNPNLCRVSVYSDNRVTGGSATTALTNARITNL